MARRTDSPNLTHADRLRIQWLSTRARVRRPVLWALVALVAILAFASISLYVEVGRMAAAAGLSPTIAFQRLGEGVMRTGNLRLIRAVADLQLSVVLMMAVGSWLIGAIYIGRLESLVIRLWNTFR